MTVNKRRGWRDALAAVAGMPRPDAVAGLISGLVFAERGEDLQATLAAYYRQERPMMVWELTRLLTAQEIGAADW